MGYNSQWKLAVQGPQKKLEKLIVWMSERASKADGDANRCDSEKGVWVTILAKSTATATDTEKMMVWGDPDTKCYPPWDRVIQDILSYARDELKIDAAYARLGESINDTEFDNGDSLYIPYTFELNDPEA